MRRSECTIQHALLYVLPLWPRPTTVRTLFITLEGSFVPWQLIPLSVGDPSSRCLDSEHLGLGISAQAWTSQAQSLGKRTCKLLKCRPPVDRPRAAERCRERHAVHTALGAVSLGRSGPVGAGGQVPPGRVPPPQGQFCRGVLLCPTCLTGVLAVCRVSYLSPGALPVSRRPACLPGVLPVCQVSRLSAGCPTCLPGVPPVCRVSCLSAGYPTSLPGALPVCQVSWLSSPACPNSLTLPSPDTWDHLTAWSSVLSLTALLPWTLRGAHVPRHTRVPHPGPFSWPLGHKR